MPDNSDTVRATIDYPDTARTPMLARYDRYILGKLMVTFGFFTFILVLVYWINRAILLFNRMVRDGDAMSLFLELTLLTLPHLIMILLPLSAFAASLTVANRLGSDSETVVLQSAGVSARRIVRPALYLGLIAAAMMLILGHFLVPQSRAQISEVERQLAQGVGAQAIDPGQFISPAPGVTVFVSEILPNGTLSDVMLSDQRDPTNRVIYTANEGYVVRTPDGPRLVLIDGLAQSLDARGSLSILNFEDFALSIGRKKNVEDGPIRDLRAYDTPTLLRADPELQKALGKPLSEFRHRAHTRFSAPLLAVFTAVLGFAALLVGGFSRFGFWQQMLAAVFLVVVLQVTNSFVEDLALKDENAWPLLYLPSGIAAALVFLLLWLADHPPRLKSRLSRKREMAT